MLGAGNQYRTRDCSVLAVFLSDLQASMRIARIQELERASNTRHPNYLAQFPLTTSFFLGEGHAATLLKQVSTDFLSAWGNRHSQSSSSSSPMPEIEPIQTWAFKNTALAVQSFVLAATSHNIDTSIMEGLDGRRVRELLRIPDRYGIPMAVAAGYAYDETESKLTARLPLEEIVFADTFGAPWSPANDDDEECTETETARVS
jgi:nitroreductase